MLENNITLYHQKINKKNLTKQGFICLYLTDRCNVKCSYCSRHKDQTGKYELSDSAIDEIISYNPDYLWLVGGGENTFIKDPDRFSKIIKKLKPKQVNMLTNGVFIPPEIEEWGYAFDYIRVSLDAHRAETYEELKGANLLPQVKENVIKLLDAKIHKVGVSYILQKKSIDEAVDFMDYYYEVFLKYGYQFFLVLKDIKNPPENRLPENELQNFLAIMKDKMAKSMFYNRYISDVTNLIEFANPHPLNLKTRPHLERCYLCLLGLFINPRGEVYPCSYLDLKEEYLLGNVNKDSWSTISKNQYEFYNSLNPTKESGCVGCWEVLVNDTVDKIIKQNLVLHPELIKFGGLRNIYTKFNKC